MSNENNPAAVRVCAISDVQCSHNCGTGACKREREARYPLEQHEAAPADRRHVGDSKFEGWYADYAAKGETNPKQIARDAYAAGMGDMTPQPAPSAPLEGTGNGAKLELASDGRALYERLHTLMPEWYPDAWGDLLPKYQSAYAEAARAPRTEVAGAVPEPDNDILILCGWNNWRPEGYVDRGTAERRYQLVAGYVLSKLAAVVKK